MARNAWGGARKRPARTPSTTTGTTSKVSNVSNTGQRSVSKQTTGSTGAVKNTTTVTNVQDSPGAPGTTSAQVNAGTSMTNLSPDIDSHLANIPGMQRGTDGSWSLTPQSAPIDVGEQVRGAFTQVEGALSQARQRALGAAPKEYHDQVNSAFDNASTQVSDHKKRLGY